MGGSFVNNLNICNLLADLLMCVGQLCEMLVLCGVPDVVGRHFLHKGKDVLPLGFVELVQELCKKCQHLHNLKNQTVG